MAIKILPDGFFAKLNMASSSQHSNLATSGWWTRSPTSPTNASEFVRFENNKRRNILTTPFYERVTQASLCGADISGNVKLYIPQDKLDDYHTEELDEFLSEFRVYKKEGDTA